MFKTKSLTEMSAIRPLNLDIINIINGIISLGVELDFKNGPWIAGGCLQRCITNQHLDNSDIDFFFNKSRYRLVKTLEILTKCGYSSVKNNDVYTLTKDAVTVQLICLNYDNVYELLGTFDFSIVRCAFDGSSFIYYKDFLKDNDNKVLNYNIGIKTKNNTAARIIKYMKRGYSLSTKDAIRLMMLNRETTKDLYKNPIQINSNTHFSTSDSTVY